MPYNLVLPYKLLTVQFDPDTSSRRISKMLHAFCDSINQDFNGHPLRVVCVSAEPAGHAILSVWYPTDSEEHAPITTTQVKERLEVHATGISKFKGLRPVSVIIAESSGTVVLEGSMFPLTYDHVMLTRELYLRRNDLWMIGADSTDTGKQALHDDQERR